MPQDRGERSLWDIANAGEEPRRRSSRPVRRALRRTWRGLWKRKLFLFMLVVLAIMGVGYRWTLGYYNAYVERITELTANVGRTDYDSNPERFRNLTRQLEIARLEPFMYGLMFIIPGVLIAVGIISILRSNTRTGPELDSGTWIKKMRSKRAEVERARRGENSSG